MSDLVRAAGGLVVRWERGRLEVLVVHRPAYGDWTFPKGKLEPAETERDAAVREVQEETGLRCLVGREVGQTEYVDSQGRPKVARYWAMTAPGSEPVAAHEVDDLRWAAPPEAGEQLTYDRDRELLERLDRIAGTATGHVSLVRHAKAGNRHTWEAPDEERPLTGPGRRQAEALAEAFRGVPFAALVSSPYVRCVQTLQPLAARLGMPVQEHAALAEGAPAAAALELVRAVSALGPSALSTHGDVQELAVQTLAASGVPLEGGFRFAKGSTWLLETRRGEVVAGRYAPPPA